MGRFRSGTAVLPLVLLLGWHGSSAGNTPNLRNTQRVSIGEGATRPPTAGAIQRRQFLAGAAAIGSLIVLSLNTPGQTARGNEARRSTPTAAPPNRTTKRLPPPRITPRAEIDNRPAILKTALATAAGWYAWRSYGSRTPRLLARLQRACGAYLEAGGRSVSRGTSRQWAAGTQDYFDETTHEDSVKRAHADTMLKLARQLDSRFDKPETRRLVTLLAEKRTSGFSKRTTSEQTFAGTLTREYEAETGGPSDAEIQTAVSKTLAVIRAHGRRTK